VKQPCLGLATVAGLDHAICNWSRLWGKYRLGGWMAWSWSYWPVGRIRFACAQGPESINISNAANWARLQDSG